VSVERTEAARAQTLGTKTGINSFMAKIGLIVILLLIGFCRNRPLEVTFYSVTDEHYSTLLFVLAYVLPALKTANYYCIIT